MSLTWILASSLLMGGARQAAAPAHTVLRFGHLWDGARLLDDVVVAVDGDRITSVTAWAAAPADAVDMRRFTAIPGLIDLHTHVTYYWDRKPGTRPLGQRRRPAVHHMRRIYRLKIA